jgi:hypothetical protein
MYPYDKHRERDLLTDSARSCRATLWAFVVVAGAGCGGAHTVRRDAGGEPDDGGEVQDGDVPGEEALLEGDWMAWTLGDCIDFEEWLSFDGEAGFIHTIVDRNACEPWGVTRSPGSYELREDHIVDYRWVSEAGVEERRVRTFALLDQIDLPYRPSYEGYLYGDRRLNWMAYIRGERDLEWRREQRWLSTDEDQGIYYDEQISISVSLDAPVDLAGREVPCQMTVELSVSLDDGVDHGPETGEETFDFPCHSVPDDALGWVRIAADGYEESEIGGSWSDFFESQGLWERYSARVSNLLYDSFRPVLYLDPADDSVLFHDRYWSWYDGMDSPPPDHVEREP